MAAFFAECIRAAVVGGSILGVGIGAYSYTSIHGLSLPGQQKPAVQFIEDKDIVGVKLHGINDADTVNHKTACLENDAGYKKIIVLKDQVYFQKKNAEADFKADCRRCEANSEVRSNGKSIFYMWSPY
jgi:hypothetical protein